MPETYVGAGLRGMILIVINGNPLTTAWKGLHIYSSEPRFPPCYTVFENLPTSVAAVPGTLETATAGIVHRTWYRTWTRLRHLRYRIPALGKVKAITDPNVVSDSGHPTFIDPIASCDGSPHTHVTTVYAIIVAGMVGV